jgi:ketosteroid isomerase-like protein
VLRCGSKAELAKDDRPRLRLTIGLRKVDGTWKIAHEHHSFPATNRLHVRRARVSIGAEQC